jgi:hypothetical protein
MDILTAVHDAASRLRDATTPIDATSASGASSPHAVEAVPPVPAIAAEAAETGETAALALLHLGDLDDAPAYLTAANAFAQLREELENALAVAVDGGAASRVDVGRVAGTGDKAHADTDQETLDWDAASTDAVTLEAALAGLAAAIITALAVATIRLADPGHVVVLSRAGLAAADAYRAVHREPSDARHLR